MRSKRTTAATFGLQLLAIMALLITANLGKTAPASAQSYGGMVIGAATCEAPATSCRSEIGAQFTVTTEEGTYVGTCTVEGDPHDNSHIAACAVAFPFEITGAVVVTENIDTVPPGYAPAENPILWEFPDPVTRPSHDVVFRNLPVGGGGTISETSNIAIVPTENGRSITDACFVLTTFGNIGCDDNRDGKITFRDVPLGAYTVHQTANLGPGRSISDFTITVTGAMDSDGWERFGATVISTSNSTGSFRTGVTAQESANGGPWIMAIQAKTDGAEYPGYTFGAHFTVTSENGDYIDECTLEPTDRIVAWWSCTVDVPSDRISLVWEDLDSIPAGYAPVENPITFDPTTHIVGPHGIGASFVNVPVAGNTTSSTTSAVGTRDIALITRDPDDGHLVLDGCYILLEYGNAACDENGDGQITYKDLPVGTYTVHQTQTPSGYPTAPDFEIRVDGPYPDVPLGYVVRQAAQQVSVGSRNVSVVFIDSRTHSKLESSICVELIGGTEPACDDALVDGQIDFLDVPAGTYPMKFTGLPAGWRILTADMLDPVATIESSPGKPSIQFIYVEVHVPDAESASSGSGGGGVATSSSGQAQRTWTAAVWVRLCDAPPSSGVEIHCQGGAGIVVNFSLTSGEFLGSCTTGEPYLTPWGPDTVSDCAVDGMPFNADIVAAQDPSTLPVGYSPLRETSTFHIGNTLQPWGDGPPFAFANYLTDVGGSASGPGTGSVTVLFLDLH